MKHRQNFSSEKKNVFFIAKFWKGNEYENDAKLRTVEISLL